MSILALRVANERRGEATVFVAAIFADIVPEAVAPGGKAPPSA